MEATAELKEEAKLVQVDEVKDRAQEIQFSPKSNLLSK
jgi:hypothetical protein